MLDSRIARAAAVVAAGGIIGFPTDTVYGIGGDFRRPAAIERIYQSKARERDKPLILLGASVADMLAFMDPAHTIARAAADAFWPGAVTLVVPRPVGISTLITAGRDSVGLRVPQHALTQALLRATGPLATTSANRSGEPAYDGTTKTELPLVDIFLDDGPTTHKQASTIVDLSVIPPQILREGVLTRDGFQAWYATLR